MSGPIEQFEIKPLMPLTIADVNVSFTNSALMMVIATVIGSFFMLLAARKKAIVPGPLQSAAEMLYEFILGMIDANIGTDGRRFFPFIFTMFMFVALGNVLGLLPYSFTYTSHVAAVGTLALTTMVILVVVGLYKNGLKFLHIFCPSGTPALLMPVLVPIEMISFVSKPFSLTVRLVANMMVGHIMLKIIAGFVAMIGLAGIVPIGFDVMITIFEMGIAFLQAYIFTILCCIYLNDALHVH